MIAAVLLGASLLLAAWSYLGYPFWIDRRARRAPSRSVRDTSTPPGVEVLVAAADEEGVIAARVANLLAQEGVQVTVRVGCDGCSDATAARAREVGSARVEVAEFAERRGKAAVLNDLVRAASAQILVFTDANTAFDPGAVRALLTPFADSAVGAVCGRLVLESDAAVAGAESAFWDRETRLKDAEGRLGVCLGANGAIYAARRELIRQLAPDTTSMDDFLIPVRIARGGSLVRFAPTAVAREAGGRDVAAEMSRRFRIGIGAGQVLRRERWLYAFWKRPLLSMVFLSRKAARWLAPVAALATVAAGLAHPRLRLAAVAVAVALLVSVLAARSRPRLSGSGGTLYYFLVLNVALAAGVMAGLAGYRRPAWRRAR